MKRKLFPICYGTALVLFTTYISLDTFVLRRSYQTDTTQMNTAMFEVLETTQHVTEPQTTTELQTETEMQTETELQTETETAPQTETETQTEPETEAASAADGQAQITLTEYYEYNTRIYVADVVLPSAQYLKTAFAEDTYGRNITAKTSEIAAAHNAVFAINGDYYGAHEHGYVIRNGIMYRDVRGSNDVLCIFADGTMQVFSPDDYTAQELVDMGVWQAFSFGPGLLADGQITVTTDQEVSRAMASNPRTAIGQISANHFIFVVSDGRTQESAGLSLYELAEFMQGLGVTTAYNLDGGGSSAMYYNGQIVNKPTTNGEIRERGVSDIVYIG
ncbi:MAG: phosphodiester glycosidase family protein [Oscillospiraceae bacterium]|nr:phosphodiester glycosidase family protein [Oscillospiraceae bacterium]